jgi:hypothetical protein
MVKVWLVNIPLTDMDDKRENSRNNYGPLPNLNLSLKASSQRNMKYMNNFNT